MIKTIFIIFLVIPFLFGLQVNSCNTDKNSNNEMIHFGPDKFTSLVIFFKKDATRQQIETFYNDVISVSRSNKGYDLPDGVALRYLIRNSDYEGVGMTFSTDATLEQRERIKKAIRESPIVYKVYENVVPNEVKDL